MSNQLRKGLPPVPARMQSLPVDARGYPVPFFVWWQDGVPDFRVFDRSRWDQCIKKHLCWLCGQQMHGRWTSFVVGPMCTVNRTTGEPPCHHDCAVFAATACPFLTLPKSKRNDSGLEGKEVRSPPGEFLKHNPGIVAIWSTKRPYALMQVDTGILIRMPYFDQLEWYTQGRVATEDEALAAVRNGVHFLREASLADGQESIDGLEEWMREGAARYPLLQQVLLEG